MDEINVLAENIIKIEEVKQEPDDHTEDPEWNSAELGDHNRFKAVVKGEVLDEEELEPPATVFLKEGYEDSLVMCSKDVSIKKEKSTWCSGRECDTRSAPCESQAPVGRPRKEQCMCTSSRHLSSDGEASAPMPKKLKVKPNKYYFCAKCMSEEASNSSKQNHSKETIHMCSICQRCFTQKRTLETHMRVHTGEKPYDCSICHRSFTQRGSLGRHMQVHSGKKPHECSECHMSYTTKGELVIHMQIHTRSMPLECSFCHKSFIHKASLNGHMQMHNRMSI